MEHLTGLILAAGKGTRMESELPKVLHRCMGKPMVCHVIEAAREAGADRIVVIAGYKSEEVHAELGDSVLYAEQTEQLGTGHAVLCAKEQLGTEGSTMVLCGDTPLISARTLRQLADAHEKAGNGVTVLSAILEDPKGYGRIIRDAEGHFLKITEDKDCTPEEKEVREINSGMYLFDTAMLRDSLGKLTNDNAQGEYYLTDTIELIKAAGGRVDAMPVEDVTEILGVNTKEQLKTAEQIMKEKKA
ncbi:MAG: NTP transferase domain-containing protein [Eubacterium sp.]|nr:NTP transferase domain-containing protein [Eubacterium sp.]